MNETTTRKSLEQLSSELLAQLSKEDQGQPTTSTSHLVGRLVKACATLEDMLRVLVEEVAEIEHRPREDFISVSPGQKASFRKATTGALAHGLKNYYSEHPFASLPLTVRALIEDLVQNPSTIWAFIAVRNDIAKNDGDTQNGGFVRRELKALIVAYRREAGWK